MRCIVKKMIFFSLVVFSLTACSDSANELSELSDSDFTKNDQLIEELQKENKRLMDQLNNKEESDVSKGTLANIRETINTTFKLIAAMNNKDYTLLRSLSSPELTINENNNTITLNGSDAKKDVPYLSPIGLNELEYRGYDQKDENTSQVFLANVSSNGAIEIYIDFVRLKDGDWLYNGHLTN